ncbi:MAG: bifunctional diaminohydroxyphosphoribosylaminopyrimidine deaminase/5-amino-6-(5-phosphoribosylamino)uracil reductase RibD [Actinomycetota bacterium]
MDETRYITRALELARLAEGRVSPRPPVGALIVAPNGDVVGEGWSTDGPGLHAEVAALSAAGEQARGATCYATLEPCLKWCTPALIASGVSRVVASITDPNPNVDGKGFDELRRAGIEVGTGPGADEAAVLIAPFTKWISTNRPFVTLKLAASLDGKVAAPDGTSRWITGEAARADVHELRRIVDAICVGSGTVITDDPLLTYRGPFDVKQPLRVVLDSHGLTPEHANVRNDDAPTLIITKSDVAAGEGGLDLDAVLDLLGGRGICHLLVEGGPTLAGSFVERKLVDKLVLYLAPKIVGGEAPGMFGDGVKTITEAWNVEIEAVTRFGDDLKIEARFPATGGALRAAPSEVN